MARKRHLLAFGAVLLGTVVASAYAATLDKTEIVHFWVAVPAGHVRRPTVLPFPARPIRLSPITIDLDRRGFLKRWIQPGLEGLSTHWIVNVGEKPVRIRMEMTGTRVPIHWKVNANFPYDPEEQAFTRPVMPGASIPNLGIDWLFDISETGGRALPGGGRLFYEGGLRLSDADTGEELTFIPIRIGRALGPDAAERRR